jgi:hypothetical protein
MPFYTVKNCATLVEFEVTTDITLLIGDVFRCDEYGCDCLEIIGTLVGTDAPSVTINSNYESCSACLLEVCGEATIITEDDIALSTERKTAVYDEILTNINSSIVISNGVNEYTLYSYDIPLPNNYVGGYLVYNAVIPMPWADFFPTTAINNNAHFTTVGSAYSLRLPNLINWRFFQSLPTLSSVFGVNATNNWLWFQENGYTISQKVTTETPDGNYTDDYPLFIRDYDDNTKINWTWEFFRYSDNAPLTVPLANEVVRVVATGDMPLNTTKNIDYATITVEGIEDSKRWLISSEYDQTTELLSPLQADDLQTRLELINVVGANRSVSLVCLLDPNKLNVENGVKFTARVFESTNEYTERNLIEFPVAKLPTDKRDKQFEDKCCDCLPELKLASTTSEHIIDNDITGVAHKNQSDTDTCLFTIYKDGALLPNEGVEYPDGFPNDPNVNAFIYNWKQYILNYGAGCYTINKDYTVAGLEFSEEIGKYNLEEFNSENSEGTTRVLYQNNFETLYDESTINYSDSGFEDSYRFRGMFGQWQPNVISESNFSVNNQNRVSSIKSKDTYILNHFKATECHINRLHKITMHAAVWRMSDHNRSNTLQESKIYECVLDSENKEQINYNIGSRITGIEIILSKRQQNSVSLFYGSVQIPEGVTNFLSNVTACSPADVTNSNGSYNASVASGGSLTVPNTTVSLQDADGINLFLDIPSTENAVISVTNENGDIIPQITINGNNLVVEDLQVRNTDGDFLVPVNLLGTTVAPDVYNVDSDGTTVPTPAGIDFVCTPNPRYGGVVIQDGLKLDLDTSNVDSYSGTGSAWLNLATATDDATIYNNPLYTNGFNGLLKYDGVQHYAIDTTHFIDITKKFTIQCMVFVDSTVSTNLPVIATFKTNGMFPLTLFLGYTAAYRGVCISGGATPNFNTNIQLSKGAWHNVLLEYNGVNISSTSSFKIEVENINVPLTSSANLSNSVNQTVIGRNGTSSAFYWKGFIPRVIHYEDKLLTTAEKLNNATVLNAQYNNLP